MPFLTEAERNEALEEGYPAPRFFASQGDRESWREITVWDNSDIEKEIKSAEEWADQEMSACPCTCRHRFQPDPSCPDCQGSGQVEFARNDRWKRCFEDELANLIMAGGSRALEPSIGAPGHSFYGGGCLRVERFRTVLRADGGLDI